MNLKYFTSIFIFFFIIKSTEIISQENNFEFLPQGLHFLPIKANYEEAKIGILYYPKNGNLKVDIGNNIDLLAFNFTNLNSKLTFSIEFMAYALSTNYAEKRLQIDALDGFFGGNAAFSKKYISGKLISRFRIIHNSAHLVDGHFDSERNQWMNNDKPIPFTKDFGELLLGYQFLENYGTLRTYSAISYSTLIRPKILEKWNSYFGFEISSNKIIDNETNIFIASNFSLEGNPKYQFNYNNLLGMKFGKMEKKGIVIYLSYFYGSNPFSEYYMKRVSQFGIGFFVDFF
ncbi:MAG: DUF1207 domain-containing protein [Ignavibacteriae bacterium]|nr:DUF1207 domain-containing protein [Ignavibacteriota bacterium]